ncbi:MAG: ABC transporter permease [Bacillota bacterium]
MIRRKHINLLQWAVFNLWRHKSKSVAILLPLSFVMAILSAVTMLKDGISRDAGLSAAFLPDLTVQSMVAGKAERLDLSRLAALNGLDGVERTVPRIWGFMPLYLNGRDMIFTVMGIDTVKMPIPPEINFSVETGRFLDPDGKREVVVGQTLAKTMKLNAGDFLPLNNWKGSKTGYKVVGIFKSAVSIYTADLILMNIEGARELFGYGRNEASDLCVYLNGKDSQDLAAGNILGLMPTARVLAQDALEKMMMQAFGGRAGIFQLFWFIALLTAVLSAWVHWSGARFMAKREIGLLKALGWNTGEIIEVSMFETALLGITATVIGGTGGTIYVLAGAPVIKNFLSGWSSVYPQFTLPYRLTASGAFSLALIGIFPLLMAGIFNAWQMGLVNPARAIKEG